jgi:hypothetical protein
LEASYIRGFIVFSLLAGIALFAAGPRDEYLLRDPKELQADVREQVIEFQSSGRRSQSKWPKPAASYIDLRKPQMDVWSKNRRHSFSVPYQTGNKGFDIEVTIVGEAMITGVVLGIDTSHRYLQDLAPVDVLVGWADFMTPEYLETLEVEFGDRSARPGVKQVGVSSLIHVAAGSPDFPPTMRRLEKGDRMVLRGYAVNARHVGGHRLSWTGDLKFGNLDCEFILVTEIYAEDENGNEKMRLSIDS